MKPGAANARYKVQPNLWEQTIVGRETAVAPAWRRPWADAGDMTVPAEACYSEDNIRTRRTEVPLGAKR